MAVNHDPDWALLSEHLDRVIELSEADQTEYLAELQRSAPEIAARLDQLLRARQRAAFSGFLEGSQLPEIGGRSGTADGVVPRARLAARQVGEQSIELTAYRGALTLDCFLELPDS